MITNCTGCGRLRGKKEHICPESSWNKGKPWSSEMKKKLSEGQKKSTVGVRFKKGNKIFLGKKHTLEAIEKIRKAKIGNQHTLGLKHSVKSRRKMSESRMGEKAGGWKGGLTKEHILFRQRLDYRLWREAVFARDNFTCQGCGVQSVKGSFVLMQADHIKPFSLFPELRLAIDNGRTLCVPCHEKTPTFLFRARQMVREDFV